MILKMMLDFEDFEGLGFRAEKNHTTGSKVFWEEW